MPVPACLQRPALSPVLEPGRAMEEPAGGGTEPWAEGLRNSNNNASPGGWPGTRGGHPLAPFGGPGAEPSYLGRVVLEIVESERTYARDLRSIVEVSAGWGGQPLDGVSVGTAGCTGATAANRGCPAGLPGQDHRHGGAGAAAGAGQRALRQHRGHLRAQQVGAPGAAGGAQPVPPHPVAGGGAAVTPSPLSPLAPCCKTWRAAPATPWPWPSASSPG